uniref:CDK5RAP1-like protein n=1 Tax=Auxenochlorella protothecoides TaxID=3075 RepID=A0A1D2A981_AUXPR
MSVTGPCQRGVLRHLGPLRQASTASRWLPEDGLTLQDFASQPRHPAAQLGDAPASTRGSVFMETYGCQMNSADSEVVHSILASAGYSRADSPAAASVVLLNTCAIRDNAEAKVWQRLGYYSNLKRAAPRASPGPVVGVLGCMAERLKHRLLESERLVDIVAGPDAYRDLPRLIDLVSGRGAGTAINVQLSADETYADVAPLRAGGSHSAYLSIMRGCNNMCAFCIVPYVRGRERSRPLASILEEVHRLSDSGFKEVTLLGQNVNSYADFSAAGEAARATFGAPDEEVYAQGFRSVYRPRRAGAVSFAELLDRVAEIDPELRVRFTSPHPKDFSDAVLRVIADRPNVCTQLHMPAQSGSSAVLAAMRRGYTREAYDALVDRVRAALPGVALSTDMISGFCGETPADHAASLDLMVRHAFDAAFTFAYSDRERTHAARHLADDVAPAEKLRRLGELVAAHRAGLHRRAAEERGRTHLVLVEGASRRSPAVLTGRTDTFKRALFADVAVPGGLAPGSRPVRLAPGDYAAVRVVAATGGALRAVALARTTLTEFVAVHGSALPLARAELTPAELAAAAELLAAGRSEEESGTLQASAG